jgi:hypothetical protein
MGPTSLRSIHQPLSWTAFGLCWQLQQQTKTLHQAPTQQSITNHQLSFHPAGRTNEELLLQLRDGKGLDWEEVAGKFNEITGENHSALALEVSYQYEESKREWTQKEVTLFLLSSVHFQFPPNTMTQTKIPPF